MFDVYELSKKITELLNLKRNHRWDENKVNTNSFDPEGILGDSFDLKFTHIWKPLLRLICATREIMDICLDYPSQPK